MLKEKEDKKKRGANFSTQEIQLMMECIMPYINILENKLTDGNSLKEKQSAWHKVFETFSSQNRESHRDINSMKMKYENIKRTLKKKISALKNNFKTTGGGPSLGINLTWYEEQLYAILQLGIEGLQSEGDSDSVQNISGVATASRVHNSVQATNLTDHCYNIIPGEESESTCAFIEDNYESLIENNCQKDEPDHMEIIYTDIDTDGTPSIAKDLRVEDTNSEIEPRKTETSNRWNLRKRKRTGCSVSAEEKKNSITDFQKLTEYKKELTEIQKKCYKVELSIKQSDEKEKQEEWQLKKNVLEMEVKIKQEEINGLEEEHSRKRSLYKLIEEQERLKIEILKCDLNNKIKQSLGLSQ